MRILVTGSTGHVGQYLVRHLLDRGAEVVALTRDRTKAARILPSDIDIVEANLADSTTVSEVFEGIDAAHLITFAGDSDHPIVHADTIVAEMERSGVKFATVLKGNLPNPPIEQALERSSIPCTQLAPVEFMDNAIWWAPQIQTGHVYEGFVDVPSTVVHESDIAEVAAVQLLEHASPGQELWITGPEAITPRRRLEIISDVLGTDITLHALSEDEIAAQWKKSGLSSRVIEFLLQMRRRPPYWSLHPSKTVRHFTGHEPIDFRTFAVDHRADLSGASAR